MMVVDPNNSNIEIIKVEIISRVQSHKAKIGGAHHWEALGNPDCSVPIADEQLLNIVENAIFIIKKR